jgi:LacI family transcriptional regulator
VPTTDYPACIVKGDDFRGAYLGTSHLIELGCKRIAYISGPLTCNLYTERYAGFEKAMTQHKIPIIKELAFYHELSVDNARKDMHRLFAKKPYPDGIFATNDSSALAALEFAKEKGITVPTQLKIVGYSNDPRSSIVSPSITTIEQFPARIAKAIVDELLKILKGDIEPVTTNPVPLVIPVQLIRRMST